MQSQVITDNHRQSQTISQAIGKIWGKRHSNNQWYMNRIFALKSGFPSGFYFRRFFLRALSWLHPKSNVSNDGSKPSVAYCKSKPYVASGRHHSRSRGPVSATSHVCRRYGQSHGRGIIFVGVNCSSRSSKTEEEEPRRPFLGFVKPIRFNELSWDDVSSCFCSHWEDLVPLSFVFSSSPFL